MDATKGLKNLLATLDAQKSRGWAAHNELDYFRPCPTCGHWFDCRNPENLFKHKHAATTSIVVTTIVQTSSGQICDPTIPLPETPAGDTKP
jgi:hypothetical protein